MQLIWSCRRTLKKRVKMRMKTVRNNEVHSDNEWLNNCAYHVKKIHTTEITNVRFGSAHSFDEFIKMNKVENYNRLITYSPFECIVRKFIAWQTKINFMRMIEQTEFFFYASTDVSMSKLVWITIVVFSKTKKSPLHDANRLCFRYCYWIGHTKIPWKLCTYNGRIHNHFQCDVCTF